MVFDLQYHESQTKHTACDLHALQFRSTWFQWLINTFNWWFWVVVRVGIRRRLQRLTME